MLTEEIKQAALNYAKGNYGDYESTSLENRIKISTARKAFIAGYSLSKSEPVNPDATDTNVGHIESESLKICPETKVKCQGNKLQCNGYCWLQSRKDVKPVEGETITGVEEAAKIREMAKTIILSLDHYRESGRDDKFNIESIALYLNRQFNQQ